MDESINLEESAFGHLQPGVDGHQMVGVLELAIPGRLPDSLAWGHVELQQPVSEAGRRVVLSGADLAVRPDCHCSLGPRAAGGTGRVQYLLEGRAGVVGLQRPTESAAGGVDRFGQVDDRRGRSKVVADRRVERHGTDASRSDVAESVDDGHLAGLDAVAGEPRSGQQISKRAGKAVCDETRNSAERRVREFGEQPGPPQAGQSERGEVLAGVDPVREVLEHRHASGGVDGHRTD